MGQHLHQDQQSSLKVIRFDQKIRLKWVSTEAHKLEEDSAEVIGIEK